MDGPITRWVVCIVLVLYQLYTFVVDMKARSKHAGTALHRVIRDSPDASRCQARMFDRQRTKCTTAAVVSVLDRVDCTGLEFEAGRIVSSIEIR